MKIVSEPVGIQTPNLLIRSQMLYSVKLQAHERDANVKDKSKRQKQYFCSANKKAIFAPACSLRVTYL